jgi:hypothetical protein
VLFNRNVSSGQGSVADTYREYVIIYAPGVLGAVLALASVQLPLVGRKWSLVLSAALQGLAMALYTQVRSTAGYVGLNALEYIMQTVRAPRALPRAHALTRAAVLQRGPVRERAGAVRHRVPRERERDALVPRPHRGHRRAVRGRALPRRELGGHPLARRGRDLARRARDGVPARRDAEPADVLSARGDARRILD